MPVKESLDAKKNRGLRPFFRDASRNFTLLLGDDLRMPVMVGFFGGLPCITATLIASGQIDYEISYDALATPTISVEENLNAPDSILVTNGYIAIPQGDEYMLFARDFTYDQDGDIRYRYIEDETEAQEIALRINREYAVISDIGARETSASYNIVDLPLEHLIDAGHMSPIFQLDDGFYMHVDTLVPNEEETSFEERVTLETKWYLVYDSILYGGYTEAPALADITYTNGLGKEKPSVKFSDAAIGFGTGLTSLLLATGMFAGAGAGISQINRRRKDKVKTNQLTR